MVREGKPPACGLMAGETCDPHFRSGYLQHLQVTYSNCRKGCESNYAKTTRSQMNYPWKETGRKDNLSLA